VTVLPVTPLGVVGAATVTVNPVTSFDGFHPYDLEVYNGGLLVSAWTQLPGFNPSAFVQPAISRIYKVAFDSGFTSVTSSTILQEQSGVLPPSATVQSLGTLSFGRRGVLFASDVQRTTTPKLVVYTFKDAVCNSGFVASTTVPGVCIVRRNVSACTLCSSLCRGPFSEVVLTGTFRCFLSRAELQAQHFAHNPDCCQPDSFFCRPGDQPPCAGHVTVRHRHL
jgi:hypothetical protein